MGIDVSHLILEALRNADNQVVDEGFDGSERCNILAGTMMEFDIDDVFRRMGEADRKMSQVLRKLAWYRLTLAIRGAPLDRAHREYLVDLPL